MPLSSYARDKYIAPEISKFTSANIRDMSQVDAEQEHWHGNFILNTTLRVNVASPHRQRLYNFLRRTHSAFFEYAQARNATLTFLEGPDRDLAYIKAIGHWEAFLGFSWQAYRLLMTNGWFKKGDGSVLQRLNDLDATARHADSTIEYNRLVDDGPLCVWLTNDGLRSAQTSLSFTEIAEILDDLARLASAVQDPLTMLEKLQQP
jgi:hypothetical protein